MSEEKQVQTIKVDDIKGDGILLVNRETKRRYAVSMLPGKGNNFSVVITWGSLKRLSKKTKPTQVQGRDAAKQEVIDLIAEKISTDERWEAVGRAPLFRGASLKKQKKEAKPKQVAPAQA